MKALTINGTNYGPFNSIEVMDDRYRCDNTDLPFVVVGQGEIVEADTVTWPDPPTPPRDILGEIAALESTITNRRVREAIRNQTGKAWLENVDDKIAALRALL